MFLSNEEFLNFIEEYNFNINKKTKDYIKSENEINKNQAANKIDEEARYEASLMFLNLSSEILNDFCMINKFLKDGKLFSNIQRQILAQIKEWTEKNIKVYKYYSDYLFFMKPKYKEKSNELKKEVVQIQIEFNKAISNLMDNEVIPKCSTTRNIRENIRN